MLAQIQLDLSTDTLKGGGGRLVVPGVWPKAWSGKKQSFRYLFSENFVVSRTQETSI